ncbi:hypothetical protein [Leptolyngbya sp. BC1307]|uniref:hypothetical protein n=1 Tax=Leptolyngbya sp. BC1307 TaxID=2029589 RepID=UPI001140F268|nr:hypothetical protein [Leptolyngbya sp. BC1307]
MTDQQLSGQLEKLKLLSEGPSFGFRNVVANWSFLEFLQYFGDNQNRQTSGYGLSPNYMEAVLNHDPYYRPFYIFLSESTTFYAGMPDKTVEIIDKGLSSFGQQKPADSYYIWRYKGTDELLFLNDGDEAQHSFEMAAQWAAESDDAGSQQMAALSAQTAAYLAANPESMEAKVNAWSSILTTAIDDATRERAVAQIRALGGDVVFSEDGGIKIEFAQEGGQGSES